MATWCVPPSAAGDKQQVQLTHAASWYLLGFLSCGICLGLYASLARRTSLGIPGGSKLGHTDDTNTPLGRSGVAAYHRPSGIICLSDLNLVAFNATVPLDHQIRADAGEDRALVQIFDDPAGVISFED